MHQTALHWAAKRDQPEIIKLLLARGAIVDAKDMGNRTPLIIASKCGNVKSVKVLLAHEANPACRTFLGYSAMDVAATMAIASYLKKGYLLWIANKFIDKSKRKEIWNREALAYFVTEDDKGIPFLM